MLSVKIGQYHPSLENSFVNTIQTLKKDGPLTPLAVVAPTNWMLNRLQERLVMRQDASPGSRYTKTSFMNISFMNFYVFASEICRRSGADVGQIVRQSAVYEYLIAGLLKQHTHGEPLFKNVQSLPALARSLYQVIQDLADANVYIDSVKEAIKEGFVEGAEIQKLNGVINLYDLFKQKLERLPISHDADIYERAASCVQDSKFLKGFKYILAYGFYDLTGVEQDFFGEIFRHHPTTLFIPYQKKHPAFAYVKPFFESFVLGMARDVEELPPVTGFSCLMNSQFEDNAHVREFQGEIQNPKLVVSEVEPSETCGEQSQTIQHPDNTQYLANVHIINASGKRDEVWTVAKEILQLAGAGYKMDEIGVVARTLEPYADAINKIFQENDIPFTTSTHEPLERYPLVKVIRQILLLKREDYYRPMVVELLDSPYFKAPAFDHTGVTPRPDLWDILSRRLGIRGGIECWLSRLEQAKSMTEETLDLDNAANMSKGVTKKVTVHPHLNLPPPPFSPSGRATGGGIQGNNEYSPPLVGGVRGGGELLRKGFIANEKKAISPIDQAIREYEEVLRERPDCVEAYLRLACAHAEKGTLDTSIENMKKAISMKSDLVEAHVYLGCLYAKKWMLDEAIKELGEAKQLRDRIVEKLVTEAERFIRDCKFDKAVSVAREVIKINSRNKKARWLLAMVYGKKGEMDEAVKE